MAKRSIQGYVELASGLGEMTRSRAKEAAQEIIALAGSDSSRKKAAKQVSSLADELLKAAEANRKHLTRLVRREVETAVGRLDVPKVATDVQALAATVAGLASQVDDLARSATGLGARHPGPVADALADLGPEPARVAPRPSTPVTRAAAAKKAPAKKAPAKKAAAKRAPAKKASTTTAKAPAKKAPAKRSTATKASNTTAEAPAKKAPAKRSTATKASTGTAKKTSASSTTAKKTSTPSTGSGTATPAAGA